MMSQPVTVFISYSVDSAEHSQRVLNLANRLRADGIDAALDQLEEAPPEGWPRWMDRQIRESDFVLIICTQRYNDRVLGKEETAKGLGVRWESTIVLQHIYDAGTLNSRFIPAFLSSADRAHIPTLLRATTHYDLSSEETYLKLYRRLTQQPAVSKPPLGAVKRLDPATPAVIPGPGPWPVSTAASPPRPASIPTAEPVSSESPTERPALRNLLMAVLISDSDFDAFCIDYYPEAHRNFSAGLDRVQKMNLLLQRSKSSAPLKSFFTTWKKMSRAPSPDIRDCLDKIVTSM